MSGNVSSENSWFLTVGKTSGTLLEIPDLLPLINSYNSAGILKKDYNFKITFNQIPETEEAPELQAPWGIAISKAGNFVIADHHSHHIYIFDQQRTFLRAFTKRRK